MTADELRYAWIATVFIGITITAFIYSWFRFRIKLLRVELDLVRNQPGLATGLTAMTIEMERQADEIKELKQELKEERSDKETLRQHNIEQSRYIRDLEAAYDQMADNVRARGYVVERPESAAVRRENLRSNMMRVLDSSELIGLCFDLRIDYDSLMGDNKETKIAALLEFASKNARLGDVVNWLRRKRDRELWEMP